MPWGRRVYLDSLGVTRARLEVVRFIGVPLGSLRQAQGSAGSFEFAWVHSSENGGRSVQSSSRVFTRAHLGVAGFFSVLVGLL